MGEIDLVKVELWPKYLQNLDAQGAVLNNFGTYKRQSGYICMISSRDDPLTLTASVSKRGEQIWFCLVDILSSSSSAFFCENCSPLTRKWL